MEHQNNGIEFSTEELQLMLALLEQLPVQGTETMLHILALRTKLDLALSSIDDSKEQYEMIEARE